MRYKPIGTEGVTFHRHAAKSHNSTTAPPAKPLNRPRNLVMLFRWLIG
jgi:hypothetical protein